MAKRQKQLEIIAAIKNNNLQLKSIILVKKVELNCLYIQPINLENAAIKTSLR